MAGMSWVNGAPHNAAAGSFATQRRRASRREEWITQSEFAELLTKYLDPSCTRWQSLDNKPLSRISGFLQKKRGIKSGCVDVEIFFRRKPSPRCPTHVVLIELKSRRGIASRSQKQLRLESLRTGEKWYMARTARAALMALHLEGAPFRRKWRPPRLEPWEGPFSDPTRRLPQHPEVAAERREAARRHRLRKELREREAATVAVEGMLEADADGYDAEDDFEKSIEVAYEAVRERVANGGPTWTPRLRSSPE
jgi:hypothetical protein